MSTNEGYRPIARPIARPTATLPDTEVLPAVPARRSLLRRARTGGPAAARGTWAGPSPFSDWCGQAQTEELPAVPLTYPRRPSRRAEVRRHLRCALIGTLLAIVAIAGLSAYAAQGLADARSTALCQAHISCK